MSKYVGVCFMDKVALLIPCYNEALSIKKSSMIVKNILKMRQFMYMITILPMTQQKSLSKKEQLLDMNINKAREM